jgi:ssDNA-binding Zn-finger/Zn-ribbon topoisomerase 1
MLARSVRIRLKITLVIVPCRAYLGTGVTRVVDVIGAYHMKCPSCNKNMGVREGPYGSFYYCPSQKVCGQKTLSVITTRGDSVHDDYPDMRSFKEIREAPAGMKGCSTYTGDCPHCGSWYGHDCTCRL